MSHLHLVYGAIAQSRLAIFSLYLILWRFGREEMVTGEIAPGGNIRGGAGVLGDEEQDLARLHGLETQAELQH